MGETGSRRLRRSLGLKRELEIRLEGCFVLEVVLRYPDGATAGRKQVAIAR